jgi:Lrp/AsnC family leucine-responsive transcriptional regulator
MRVVGKIRVAYDGNCQPLRFRREDYATIMQLDRIDRKILAAVQTDCSIGADELGALCGASPSTALRRLKKLRATGVIMAEVAVLDRDKVGRALLMIVSLRLEREDARIVAEFRRSLEAHPAVMQMYFVTGAADYVLLVSAGTMAEFDQFIETMLVSNPHVAMTETHVVLRPLKVGLSVPVAD